MIRLNFIRFFDFLFVLVDDDTWLKPDVIDDDDDNAGVLCAVDFDDVAVLRINLYLT